MGTGYAATATAKTNAGVLRFVQNDNGRTIPNDNGRRIRKGYENNNGGDGGVLGCLFWKVGGVWGGRRKRFVPAHECPP
jgi:hypothetical protein